MSKFADLPWDTVPFIPLDASIDVPAGMPLNQERLRPHITNLINMSTGQLQKDFPALKGLSSALNSHSFWCKVAAKYERSAFKAPAGQLARQERRALRVQEADMARGAAELEAWRVELVQYERTVSAWEREISKREQAIAERERAIAERERAVTKMELAVGERELAVSEHELALMQQELAAAEQKLAEVTGHTQEADSDDEDCLFLAKLGLHRYEAAPLDKTSNIENNLFEEVDNTTNDQWVDANYFKPSTPPRNESAHLVPETDEGPGNMADKADRSTEACTPARRTLADLLLGYSDDEEHGWVATAGDAEPAWVRNPFGMSDLAANQTQVTADTQGPEHTADGGDGPAKVATPAHCTLANLLFSYSDDEEHAWEAAADGAGPWVTNPFAMHDSASSQLELTANTSERQTQLTEELNNTEAHTSYGLSRIEPIGVSKAEEQLMLMVINNKENKPMDAIEAEEEPAETKQQQGLEHSTATKYPFASAAGAEDEQVPYPDADEVAALVRRLTGAQHDANWLLAANTEAELLLIEPAGASWRTAHQQLSLPTEERRMSTGSSGTAQASMGSSSNNNSSSSALDAPATEYMPDLDELAALVLRLSPPVPVQEEWEWLLQSEAGVELWLLDPTGQGL